MGKDMQVMIIKKVKLAKFLYGSGVVQRVPGSQGSHIS
jgi:hypothetical protein